MGLTRAEKKYFLDRMNATARKVTLGDLLLDKFAVTVAASDPSSPWTGQIYFNTGDSSLRVYNGSAWVKVTLA